MGKVGDHAEEVQVYRHLIDQALVLGGEDSVRPFAKGACSR